MSSFRPHRRGGVLVSALAGALAFPIAAASADGGGSLAASARVKLAVVVPQVLRWKHLPQTLALRLSPDDVARGFAEWVVDDLAVISNLRLGFQLVADPAAQWITTLDVEPVAVRGGAPSGAWAHSAGVIEVHALGAVQMSLRLRARLAATARPGLVVPVPVTWRLQPI